MSSHLMLNSSGDYVALAADFRNHRKPSDQRCCVTTTMFFIHRHGSQFTRMCEMCVVPASRFRCHLTRFVLHPVRVMTISSSFRIRHFLWKTSLNRAMGQAYISFLLLSFIQCLFYFVSLV